MSKPDVDLIEGLSPAISIEQKTTSRNPRSTVGTVTEIHDYMRLLWARVGVPYSPATGLPIESQTVSQMVDKIIALPEGDAALSAGARGARPQGRVPQGDRRVAAGGLPAAEDRRRILSDRGRAGPGQEVQARHRRGGGPHRHQGRAWSSGWPTSLETALRLADGIAVAEWADVAEGESEPRRLLFSEKFACPVSGFTISRDRAAAVLVQQPVRRLPGLRRPGREAGVRRRPGGAGQGQDPAQGRGRALGQGPLAALHPDPAGAGAALRLLDGRRRGGSCRTRRKR